MFAILGTFDTQNLVFFVNFMESLILAQDERWRRA